MNYDGRMVTPDRRKGLVVLKKEDGIMKFQWLDASSRSVIEEFMLFPGDAKFEKVKQSEDRVYILTMISSGMRNFYWFQVSKLNPI